MIGLIDRAHRTREPEHRVEVDGIADNPPDHDQRPVAVVELFTSEGCSSCPPADHLLGAIDREARERRLPVFTLGFHVDYWDFQGWPDRFATREHTARQTAYADVLGRGRLYTPQMVVNGAVAFVGSRGSEAWKQIHDALAQPAATSMRITAVRPATPGSTLRVSYEVADAPEGVVANVALLENGLEVKVGSGENAGLTLHHDGVVRMFETAPLRGERGEITFEVPADVMLANSAVVAYVQLGNAGRIVAAARAAVPDGIAHSSQGGDDDQGVQRARRGVGTTTLGASATRRGHEHHS